MICRFFFFKQKTAYEIRSSDWSSDVCSSDLGLDQVVAERLRLDDRAAESADLSEWLAVVEAAEYPIDEVTIGIVGKYVDHKDAYKSVGEALKHGGIRQRTRVNLKWLESQDIERDGAAKVLEGLDGILVPGGF